MKLSEIKGERAVEVIADLIEPITNIASDQDELKLFRNERRKNETDREFGAREIKEKIPRLLKTHKQDILAILCIVNDTKPEDLSVFDIINGTIELANDKEFQNLFLSANRKAGQTQHTEHSADADHSEPEF